MTVIANDIDVDLQVHLRENLNNHIWRCDDSGEESHVYEWGHSRIVHLYNDLLTGRVNVLFQEEWKRVLLAAMNPVT